MIKSLRLENWKSFRDGELFIDPLTIIIGTNASGKSNTLDALLFLNRIASGVGILQAINGDVNLAPLRGGVEWVCRKPLTSFTLELVVEYGSYDYRYTITIGIESGKAMLRAEKLVRISQRMGKEINIFYTKADDIKAPTIPAYFYTGKQGPGRRLDFTRNACILSQCEIHNLRREVNEGIKGLLHTLQNIFIFDPIPSHMRQYSSLSDKLMSDGSNLAGVLASLDKDRKEIVETTLTNYIQDIPEKDIKRVWAETIGKFNADAMLYCEEGWGLGETNLVDARGMSDGTLRYLAIVTAMLTRTSGDLLVVEEVDNGLHPSRANVLINMLKELGDVRKVDVIVTTHNPALLDAAGVEMIPFITVTHRNEMTGESRLSLLENIEELPKLISMGTIGQLSTSGVIESALKREDYDS